MNCLSNIGKDSEQILRRDSLKIRLGSCKLSKDVAFTCLLHIVSLNPKIPPQRRGMMLLPGTMGNHGKNEPQRYRGYPMLNVAVSAYQIEIVMVRAMS